MISVRQALMTFSEDHTSTARATFAAVARAYGAAFAYVLAARGFIIVIKIGRFDRHVHHIRRLESEVVVCPSIMVSKAQLYSQNANVPTKTILT